MLLSESYKNRLLELAGIIQERDNRPTIIQKLKLPPYVADWVHNLSEKYSIWIANSFKQYVIQNEFPQEIQQNIINSLETGKSPEAFSKVLRKYMSRLEGDYRHILDWLQGRQTLAPETDKIDFKELTFEQAKERSEAWHRRLAVLGAGTAKIEDEDGEVIKTYPDGFYWINLGKNVCDAEGKAMGHCGRGEGNLFSLRRDKRPYITADILENGIVRQMRGRGNTKPLKDYHPYIIDLIKSDLVKYFDYWDYRIENNFWLHDLNQSQTDKIIKEKPILLKNQKLRGIEFSEELLNYIAQNIPEMLIDIIRQKSTEELKKIKPEIIEYLVKNKFNEILPLIRLEYLIFPLTENQLQYIMDKYPDKFASLRLYNREDFSERLISHMLETFIGLNTIEFKPIKHLNDKHRDYIVQKEISEEWELLENKDLTVFKFNPKQINLLLKYKTSLFHPETQNFDELNLTTEQRKYIVKEEPDFFNEIQIINTLGDEEGEEYYRANKDKFKSLYLAFKFEDNERLNNVKTSWGSFKNGNVYLEFDEWSDNDLTGLFKNEDVAKQIANFELDFYGYDFSINDLSYDVDDISDENFAKMKKLIDKNLISNDKEVLIGLIEKDKIENRDDVYEVLKNTSDFENSDDLNEIRHAFIRATEDAQRYADEDEYWKLYTNPIKDLFGEPEWITKKVKSKNKETGKEETKKINKLQFKISYSDFEEYLRESEAYNADTSIYGSTGYLYSINETITPFDVINEALHDSREYYLEINEPHYGVSGDRDKDAMNERLSDELYGL